MMPGRKTRCLASALMLASSAAQGAELPAYDSKSYCKTTAAMLGAAQNMFMESCLQSEERFKGQITSKLDRFDSDTLGRCDSMARLVGGGSYQGFAGCLSMDVADRFLKGKIDIVPR